MTKPRVHRGAMACTHWRDAMEVEFSALQANKTWRLVPPVPGVNIIDSKWVFKVKQKNLMGLLKGIKHVSLPRNLNIVMALIMKIHSVMLSSQLLFGCCYTWLSLMVGIFAN
jgi:hypothetical protein